MGELLELLFQPGTRVVGFDLRLENAKMSDMRDWPRSFHVESGKWAICEDITFGGKCISFHGPATINLETVWNGNWDCAISSSKPLACE